MLKKSLAILIFLFAAGSARAQSDDSGEDAAATKAISPYFDVAGGDPDTDRLPLKSLSADLRITGAIAAVKVIRSSKTAPASPSRPSTSSPPPRERPCMACVCASATA